MKIPAFPRSPASSDDIALGHKPIIPSALPDGLIPTDALTRGLVVHAPAVHYGPYDSFVGDPFELVLDGQPMSESRTIYTDDTLGYVEITLPPELGTAMAEGFHDIGYLTKSQYFGDPIRSEPVQVLVDRTAAGNRGLPRIVFPEAIQRDGLSLSALAALPNGVLVGTIADYANVAAGDTIHVFMRAQGSTEVHVSTTAASNDAELSVIKLDRAALEKPGKNGTCDIYYYVEDRAGNRSLPSLVTPVELFLHGAPTILPPIVLRAADDGLITDRDIKPSLSIDIPAIYPKALPGDYIELLFGARTYAYVELTEEEASADPMLSLTLGYDYLWAEVRDESEPRFSKRISYVHRRARVPSRSPDLIAAFDLSVPGGRDPNPDTNENEALPLPVLRGASGTQDNLIDIVDLEAPATVHIDVNSAPRAASSLFAPGDIITLSLDDNSLGSTFVVKDAAKPIVLPVTSNELKASAGQPRLRYSVERKLSIDPHTSTGVSMPQLVQIDSTHGLPGAGNPLPVAILPLAVLRERNSNVYGLTSKDLVDEVIAIRIYAYQNMKVGDVIEVAYVGYDKFDGGVIVPEASGSVVAVVTEADLLPRIDDSTEKPVLATFTDLPFLAAVALKLAFGRFLITYKITNRIGTSIGGGRTVLVNARRQEAFNLTSSENSTYE